MKTRIPIAPLATAQALTGPVGVNNGATARLQNLQLQADKSAPVQRLSKRSKIAGGVMQLLGPSSNVGNGPGMSIQATLLGVAQDNGRAMHVRALANHLIQAINAISAGQWATADGLLYNRTFAKNVGASINLIYEQIDPTGKTPHAVASEITEAAIKGMYYADSKKLDLPSIGLVRGNDYGNAQGPQDNPDWAWIVYPVLLEEWIHMFQNEAGRLVSQSATMFAQGEEFAQNPDWDAHEMDIYAIYRELQWDTVLDAFVGRYTVRRAFADWRDSMDYLVQNQGKLSANKRHAVRL